MHIANGQASINALPNELLEMIFVASLTNNKPVPALAIAWAGRFVAIRTLAQVCRRFRDVFGPLMQNQATHINTFLQNTTFRFNSSTELQHIPTMTPVARLQTIHSMEIECRWMRRNYSHRNLPHLSHLSHRDYMQQMAVLTGFTNLRLLRICYGPLDVQDDYGYRRWMDKAPLTRRYAYSQALRDVSQLLPNLPNTVLLEVFIDPHAGWDGPELWREARALVWLRYRQVAAGNWSPLGMPDEQEEQVTWTAGLRDGDARERL